MPKEGKKEEEKKVSKGSESEGGKQDPEKDSQNPEGGKEEELTEEQKKEAMEKAEAEAKKREGGEEPQKKEEPKKEEPSKKKEEEEDDFWKDEEKLSKEDIDRLVSEKVKPIIEQDKARKQRERKYAREAFFKKHPEYLTDSRRWQQLLDELGDFDPNKIDEDYSGYLEKAHRIVDGTSASENQIQDIHNKQAADASSGEGTRNPAEEENPDTEGLSRGDYEIAKAWGVSPKVMKEMEEKQKDGSVTLFYPH